MEKHKIKFVDWGFKDYKESWDKQKELFNLQIENKLKGLPTNNYLIFVEHPHVYTLGYKGNTENLLITDEFLKQINATFYKIERGGDITYHGPGQIVGYPIFDLEALKLSYKDFINKIEDAIIKYLKKEHNIDAFKSEKAIGVWVKSSNYEEKICAIGIRASRYITMHGFAFNVNTNLDYFQFINPCGIKDKGVTSLQELYGKTMNYSKEKQLIIKYFINEFNAELMK